MIDPGSLLAISGAFFVAAASPGPATIGVVSVSMRDGRKAGLMFGLGLSVGLAFWGLVAAGGLGAVLLASGHALTVLKLIGGGYLLWLAFGAARSAAASRPVLPDLAQDRRSFVRGLLLNLSNPKAVFAWMAVLALGLNDGSAVGHVALATGICIVLGFLIYGSYAVVFSAPGAMQLYSRSRRWIEGAVAGLFAVAGFGLIRSALTKQ